MSIRHLTAAALLSLHLAGGPAIAQETTTLAQQTPAPAREMPADEPAISIVEARHIALDNGVARIEAIELEDGVWAIDGRDGDDGEIVLDIDARDGRVLRLERERPESSEMMR